MSIKIYDMIEPHILKQNKTKQNQKKKKKERKKEKKKKKKARSTKIKTRTAANSGPRQANQINNNWSYCCSIAMAISVSTLFLRNCYWIVLSMIHRANGIYLFIYLFHNL